VTFERQPLLDFGKSFYLKLAKPIHEGTFCAPERAGYRRANIQGLH
jgi:hypothetical protein